MRRQRVASGGGIQGSGRRYRERISGRCVRHAHGPTAQRALSSRFRPSKGRRRLVKWAEAGQAEGGSWHIAHRDGDCLFQMLCRRSQALWRRRRRRRRAQKGRIGERGEPRMPQPPPKASSGPGGWPWTLCGWRSPGPCSDRGRSEAQTPLTAAGAPATPLAVRLRSKSLKDRVAYSVGPVWPV